jgi:hypothetical protein
VTGFRPPPERHWRSYGTDPLPTPQEALGQPFRAFPSWFLRIECDRCAKATMLNDAIVDRNPIVDDVRHHASPLLAPGEYICAGP